MSLQLDFFFVKMLMDMFQKPYLNKNQLKLGISKYKLIEELLQCLEKRLKEKNE